MVTYISGPTIYHIASCTDLLLVGSSAYSQADGGQVDCMPTANIAIRILDFRPTAGGYLKLVLLNVAGSGALSTLGVRKYQTSVGTCLVSSAIGITWSAAS